MSHILKDFRSRRDIRPEFSVLVSKKFQLNSMYAGYLFYSIHLESAKLLQYIQRDFPEDILEDTRMKEILDELKCFMENDIGIEEVVGKEAFLEIQNAHPLYDIE